MTTNNDALLRGSASGFTALAAALLAAAVLSGCAATYGGFQADGNVLGQFEAGSPPAGYAYYWYGHANRYYAVAGLDPRLELQSSLWRRIEPGSEEFRRAVAWIWVEYGFRPYGAAILDGEGRRVGVWFSSLRYPSVKFTGASGVDLIPDMPFLGGPSASTAASGARPPG
jgi:hypothetical protein